MRTRWVCATLVLATVALNPAAAQQGNPEAGKNKSGQCSGCHEIPGYRTVFPRVYTVPKLGGQHPEYIASALKAYQQQQRASKTMQAIASGLSDQDIADLAAYYGEKK
jgi:cytochrome c553